MTDNDKSLINIQFMKFAMKELRKYFAESELEQIDQQTLLSSISKGATLIQLKIHVTEILVRKEIESGSKPPLL